MKPVALLCSILALAACAGGPPPKPLPPQPQAPRLSNRLTPIASLSKTITEPHIRVGMLSDQPSVTFARIAGGYYVLSESGASVIKRGFTITAPLANALVRYAVQFAAISDKPSAEAFAERLRGETGLRVDSLFDPSAANGGVYRILAGDFADGPSAQALRDQLVQRGYAKEMTIVRRPLDQPFERKHEVVDDEDDRYTITGESLLIIPVASETITIADKPYRTAARIFINSRGLFNLINELNLEDYLRGVVPAEMGSRIYDELEGLKAQAIAARTYAIRSLGQFASEGFDICPGPACQAYKGFTGEEALTDQAVRETLGLIMTYEGQPINALYTSTCGGETSAVGTMFPGRSEPYLERARCVELEMVTLEGRADSAILTEPQVNAHMFASFAQLPETVKSWSARDVETAVGAAQHLLGVPPASVPRPPYARRGDVLNYLAAVMGLDAKARVLTLPEDRKYFFPQTSDPEGVPYQAAAFLIKYGLMPVQEVDRVDLEAPMPREELYALLGSWLREHDVLTEASGKVAALDGRNLALKAEGKIAKFRLPAGIPIYRRLGDRFQEYRSVPVMIGDRASLLQNRRKVPVALIVQANLEGASFDRTGNFANWTRSYRADELVTSINKRNPIQQLLDLKPLTIDASQRIAEMEVTAEGGRTFILRGLPVRWSLNVPDNLFVYEKTKDPDGVDRYTFFGKGWGHGVGMCQVGAYGMAFRGYTAEQILKRYYTGVEIQRWNPSR